MLERIQSDVLKRVYEYWDGKRGGRRAPARADIDPVDLAGDLPNVFLIDVEDSPRQYHIRLMGQAFIDEFGENVAGRCLHEIDLGEAKDSILAAYDELVATWEPMHVLTEYSKADGRRIRFERLALPLSSDGKTVDKVLGAMVAKSLSIG